MRGDCCSRPGRTSPSARKTLAELKLEALRAEVDAARKAAIAAKASGRGERAAVRELERAEARLRDPDLQLAPAAYGEQYERLCAEWAAHRAQHAGEIRADFEA